MDRGDLVGPVVIHSADTIEYANAGFCDLVGVDAPAAVVGRGLGEFVDEPGDERLAEHFDRLDRDDRPVRGLAVVLDREGGAGVDAVAVSSPVEWEGEQRIHTAVMDAGRAGADRKRSPEEIASHYSPIGVTIADATAEDEPLVYVNETFVELTGYAESEAVGRNCRFLQGPETSEETVARMRAAIDDERPITVTLRNYRKDGSLFWNRITITPVRDATGAVTHFFGFQEDVTETKLTEREKSLFEAHAEMSEQVMYIIDAEGTIEYVNPAFEHVTGYAAAEAVGKTPEIIRSDRQDDAFYDRMWETITRGEVWEAELTNRTKWGELYRSEQKVVPIRDDLGSVTHFAVIEPDVTDEQLASQALDVLNRILRHNVRTSVNVIDGYTDLLESGVEGAERRAAIRIIRERTASLKDISDQTATLRNLLDQNQERSPLPVSRIADLVAEFRETYPGATIELATETGGDPVIRNGAVFRIAFEEVVENAVVHTDGPARVEVTVRDSDVERMVDVEVADDGPGIPEPEWEIIKTGTETPLHHTNSIGLWVIYWSVTALGGSIDLSRNDPHGSVLTLQVPVGDPERVASGPRGADR